VNYLLQDATAVITVVEDASRGRLFPLHLNKPIFDTLAWLKYFSLAEEIRMKGVSV
jgi:hypothetical protein